MTLSEQEMASIHNNTESSAINIEKAEVIMQVQ